MLPTMTLMSETKSSSLAEPFLSSAGQAKSTLLSYTVPWPRISLLAFLHQAGHAPRLYWENEQLDLGLAGYGVALTLQAHDQSRFESIQRQARRLFEQAILLPSNAPAGVGPRLFGGFAFQVRDRLPGLWSAFPAACFMLPRYQLTHTNGQAWLTVNHLLPPQAYVPHTLEQLRADIRRLPATPSLNGASKNRLNLRAEDLTAQAPWCQAVAQATRRIQSGSLDKVVLARARRLEADRPIAPLEVLARLRQKYPNCYRFLFEPVPGHAFYGATPELLAEVNGAELRTVALAGSIGRGQTLPEDEALGRQLLANPKERHEHALVVEAVQESLQPLVSHLSIAAQPSLLKLSNIQHLQTEITGRLTGQPGILPVVAALHPTPALGGRPRALALPLIEETEPVARGWYGSPIGWLDSDLNGMFAVAIRSAVSAGQEALLYAGAGIVADSVPEKEWQETQLKFRPLLEALAGEGCP